MNTKNKILNNIKLSTKNRDIELEEIHYSFEKTGLIDDFIKSLESVSAGYRFFTTYEEALRLIDSIFPGKNRSINTIAEIELESFDLSQISSPKDIHPLDLAVINGKLGVAENGAIWIDAGSLPYRAIPFICENLVVVIDAENIVENMHEAYQITDSYDYDYGVFITGPSKTADIEQTLVIGAQGARKMLVLIKN